jgi:Ino eighty subunit 1
MHSFANPATRELAQSLLAITPYGEDNRPTKQKLATPILRVTPTKKIKKVHNNVLSSARSRHLKKDDGHPFWRKDIQYAFLKALFDNDVKAFTDPFPDSEDNVIMEDRQLDPRGRLSFAELYIKTIAHSSKCSKVLKERLLKDMKMSIPTCMICLLVNVGRMNTTINFVPDMKSQLRTYHSIPSLQVNYDSATTGNDKSNDKQLQDTPRLKSILKACCDDNKEPHSLEGLEQRGHLPTTTIVNLIFVLCNEEEKVIRAHFMDSNYAFYDIFMNASYDPRSRADLFLWLLWYYLECHKTEEELTKNPFGVEKPALKPAVMEFDIDTPLEREFGEKLLDQRVKYLADDSTDKKEPKPESKEEKKSSKEDSAALSTLEPTPTITNVPQQPVLRQDIDVEKVRAYIKLLRKSAYRKRQRMGQLKFENAAIAKQGTVEEEVNGRMKLKNYKGDYGEYSSKFNNLFHALKNDFSDLTRGSLDKSTDVEVSYDYEEGSAALKSFDIDIDI